MKRLYPLLFVCAIALAQNTAQYPTKVPTAVNLGVASNRAETALTTGINASATSIPVASSSGFKAGAFATIDNEILHVCAIPDGTHLRVGISACPNVDGRGTDTANFGGAAASHLANAKVQGRIVAWNQNQAAAEIIAIATELDTQVFNVMHYGAKGDCSHDDTGNIRNAVTALNASGKPATLFFPQGCYLVNPLATTNSPASGAGGGDAGGYLVQIATDHTTVTGPGATIKLAPGHNYRGEFGMTANHTWYWVYFQFAASYCKLTDLTIDSNGMGQAGNDHSAGHFWATGARFIKPPGSANAEGNSVTDTKFLQLNGWPVFGELQYGMLVDHNYATGGQGFALANGSRWGTISNNVSRNAYDAHYAVNGGTSADSIVSNMVISGNIADSNINGSGIDVTAAENIAVTGNTVSNNQGWCILVDKSNGPYGHGPTDQPSRFVNVSGNVCRDNNIYIGFGNDSEIEVGDTLNTAMPGQMASYVTVANNLIHTINPRGIGVETGYGASHVTIVGNNISGCGWSGFPCQYPGTNYAPILDRSGDEISILDNVGDSTLPGVIDLNAPAGRKFHIAGNVNLQINDVFGVNLVASRTENSDTLKATAVVSDSGAISTRGLSPANLSGAPHWRIDNGATDDAHVRFAWGLAGAEAAGNAGADLLLWSYDNTGTYLQNPLKIQRSDGKAYFSGEVDAPGIRVGSIAANGNPGLSISKVVKGSDGLNCVMQFSSGILIATNCP